MDVKERKAELEKFYTQLCCSIGECKAKMFELEQIIDDKLLETKKLADEYKELEIQNDTDVAV